MRVIWSPLAVDQIRDIASYIALDKPAAAIQWAEKVFNAVEILTNNPQSGRIVPEINRKEIRKLVLGNYRVIYKIKSKPTEILILIVKRYRQKLADNEIETP